jgi:hypothetical protein
MPLNNVELGNGSRMKVCVDFISDRAILEASYTSIVRRTLPPPFILINYLKDYIKYKTSSKGTLQGTLIRPLWLLCYLQGKPFS